MSITTKIVCSHKKKFTQVAEEIIKIFIDKKWVQPMQYGKLSIKNNLHNPITKEEWLQITKFCETEPSLLIYGKAKKYLDFFNYREGDSKFYNSFFHYNSNSNYKDFSNSNYCLVITKIMKLTDAYYACCQTEGAENYYRFRLEQEGVFKVRKHNVSNIGEGLTNPAWKMWFGERYIAAFGKAKLLSAPCFEIKDYGHIIYINLFKNPDEWKTEKTLEVVEDFKIHIGNNCFYDSNNIHQKLMTPDFSDI